MCVYVSPQILYGNNSNHNAYLCTYVHKTLGEDGGTRMKCYVHQNDDAVAVCKSCGKGVCNDCAIIISGNSYCKTCIESKGTRPPQPQTTTTPTGVASKTQFTIGAAGAIISGIIALLFMFSSGFAVFWWFLGISSSGFFNFIAFIVAIALVVGLLMAGLGYLGIKRSFGRGIGTAGFAFSIIVSVFLLVNAVLGLIALVSYTGRYSTNLWSVIYMIWGLVTVVMFGVMQILWGVAHIQIRQHTVNPGLTMATGIITIIAGALTISWLASSVGIVLFFVSQIMAFIVFLVSIPELT